MSYTADGFTLAYPEPLTEEEWARFRHSLAPQVMLWWDQATAEVCGRFAQITRRHAERPGEQSVRIILRLPTEMLTQPMGPIRTELLYRQRVARGCIAALILGNEWDADLSFRWGAPTWGNQRPNNWEASPIEQWANRIGHAAHSLSGCGVALVSPAYRMRGFTEDDQPEPGLFTARELTGWDYYGYASPIAGNAVHFYDYDWTHDDPPPPEASAETRAWVDWAARLAAVRVSNQVNVDRFKHWLRFWSGYHHHPLYIDESNTNNERWSAQQHMWACIEKSRLLIHEENAEGYKLGERVAMYSPFAMNGLANYYPAQYIMRSESCYDLVRQHMDEEGYYD